MQTRINQFHERLQEAVISEQLKLPSLPEIALRVREECEKDNTSAQSIADVIAQDPAITVRLLRIANSPMYRSRQSVENLQIAVTRLGLRLVRDLVISLAMKQLYHSTSATVNACFHELWIASVKTATLSRMLAIELRHIENEQAMLGGLIHNIGALPILMMAEEDDELFEDPHALNQLIRNMQGDVGAYLFRMWDFPSYMIEVARQCYNFERQHDGAPDYLDIIQVALVQGSIYTGIDCPDNWDEIPAFGKLGITTADNFLEIEDNKIAFEENQLLFS